MTEVVRLDGPVSASPVGSVLGDIWSRLRRTSEYVVITALALAVSAALFTIFLQALGKSALQFYGLIWTGAFGTAFSWQNTLLRASPLILTALCVALPARIGLVIIGGEGALVLGGFVAGAISLPLAHHVPWLLLMAVMLAAAMVTGALWIGFVGFLKFKRGVNETIASLLLTYIAIAIMNFFVEGLLRDPGSSNKPSTRPIGEDQMIGTIPGLNVHWGLAAGLALSVLLWVLMSRTTFGFAARMTGGNPRAARAQGLPIGKLMISLCAIAGACAGLAGFFEVAAVQGTANGSLAAGYGFTGILVAFLARHNPLAIVPVAVLFGGFSAAGA